MSSIPARSLTVVEIDREIISMDYSLPSIQKWLSVTRESMCMKYWLTV